MKTKHFIENRLATLVSALLGNVGALSVLVLCRIMIIYIYTKKYKIMKILVRFKTKNVGAHAIDN